MSLSDIISVVGGIAIYGTAVWFAWKVVHHDPKLSLPVPPRILTKGNSMIEAVSKPKAEQLSLNYDSEGDVLYVNFGLPQEADDSDLTDEGIIVHCKGEKLVGLTILNAKDRLYDTAFLETPRSET